MRSRPRPRTEVGSALVVLAVLAIVAVALRPARAQQPPQPPAGPDANPALAELQAKARARMERDQALMSNADAQALETLYQRANRDLKGPDAKPVLREVVEKYPHTNRAGCAVLYLAQLSSGTEREAYLRRAIAEHFDDWYGDGTQVGPLARAQLAAYMAATGQRADAVALASSVARDFPEAVDHGGRRLAEILSALGLLEP